MQLLDLFNNTSPPFIGPVSTVTINILPNDSPQGEFVLEQSTLSLPEGNANHTLRVLREAGAFGEVSVSVFALLTSATIDLDFSFRTIVRSGIDACICIHTVHTFVHVILKNSPCHVTRTAAISGEKNEQ